MNLLEIQRTLRTVHFSYRHADLPEGILPLRPGKWLVWAPEALEHLFRGDQTMSHPGSRSLTPLLGARSMISMDGPRHRDYRRVLGTALLGERNLSAYHDIITDSIDRALATLTPGTEFILADWTRQVTLDIIARITFGDPAHDAVTRFATWIHKALGSRARTLAHRLLAGGLPRAHPQLERDLVRTARTASDPTTLAARLLSPDSPLHGIDDQELRDQIVSLLFAGHETTASATASTLYWLITRPELRDTVLDELGDDGNGATIKDSPTLHAVLQESLRLMPPVEVAGNRVLRTDTEIRGRHCPAGTIITPAILMAHHRASLFPRPHHFDPARFRGRDTPQPGYLPFGGGTRTCPGRSLGELESRMISAAVLRHRRLHCLNPDAGNLTVRGHALALSRRLRVRVVR